MKTRQENRAEYAIHSYPTGNVLIDRISLDSDEIDSLSGDSSDGTFLAGHLFDDELIKSGIPGETQVYAVLR